ncbi:hypothetical protein HY642_06855 [Candidatus Woesearchaeota archaeon]|nr:hypothetical protein [Candidatus Woesearchaeota archaeon]
MRYSMQAALVKKDYFEEDEDTTDDVYNAEWLSDGVEAGDLDAEIEAYMTGYLSA